MKTAEIIHVGRLFNPYDPTTIDVTMAAIRDGIDKTSLALGAVRPSVLKGLVKRHKRIVVMSA